ncbi:MAG TPA: hypothetical protein VF121_01255 [Thermoanaerobaculia bacterium]|nr:hypothetical protein [Thermoanaerobaculia bacterium]
MSAKRGKSGRGRPERERPAAPRRRPRWLAPHPAWVFLWAVLVHGVFLAGSPDRREPASALLYGDSIQYLLEARALVEGTPFNEGLPFHPPLTAWLLAPLWLLSRDIGTVSLLAKCLMALASAGVYTIFLVLARGRVPHAFWICLLLPLNFGELVLSSAVTSEAVYRLLLGVLLLLGTRAPAASGVVHAAATLARAEHLLLALPLLVVGLARPRWRRTALVTAAPALLLLAANAAWTARGVADYNRRHAAELAEPLPAVVPVSIYGPLNFALAQGGPDIHFSRATLPPAPAGAAQLEPRFAPHNRYLLHGYRIGLERIARRPGRFVARTAAKLWHSTKAAAYGWTGLDLPKHGPAEALWARQPVDMAYAEAPVWHAASLMLIAVGAWRLRRERTFLIAGGALLAYRLAVNALFFPYLRGMVVVSPFYLALLLAGVALPFHRAAGKVLAGLLVVLALIHFTTAALPRRYLASGERDASGAVIDDRLVQVKRAPAG